MANTFRCRLITPEAQVFDDAATAAVVPVWDGQMGFLPDRAAFVGEMGAGELRVDFPDKGQIKGGSRYYFVADGFVQMLNNELTILAASATSAETLTESAAQSELAGVMNKSTAGMSATDAERLNNAKRRAQSKLASARKFKSLGGI